MAAKSCGDASLRVAAGPASVLRAVSPCSHPSGQPAGASRDGAGPSSLRGGGSARPGRPPRAQTLHLSNEAVGAGVRDPRDGFFKKCFYFKGHQKHCRNAHNQAKWDARRPAGADVKCGRGRVREGSAEGPRRSSGRRSVGGLGQRRGSDGTCRAAGAGNQGEANYRRQRQCARTRATYRSVWGRQVPPRVAYGRCWRGRGHRTCTHLPSLTGIHHSDHFLLMNRYTR